VPTEKPIPIGPDSSIPVYDLTALRQHVQQKAKEQWSEMNAAQMVMVGITPFSNKSNEETTKWYLHMRQLFELSLPDELIIRGPKGLILISRLVPTYAA
jgi:hypothetical protein